MTIAVQRRPPPFPLLHGLSPSSLHRCLHLPCPSAARLTGKPVLGFLVLGVVWAGPVKTLTAGGIVGMGYLFWQQVKQPGTNAGHRAGGKGFSGPLPYPAPPAPPPAFIDL